MRPRGTLTRHEGRNLRISRRVLTSGRRKDHENQAIGSSVFGGKLAVRGAARSGGNWFCTAATTGARVRATFPRPGLHLGGWLLGKAALCRRALGGSALQR